MPLQESSIQDKQLDKQKLLSMPGRREWCTTMGIAKWMYGDTWLVDKAKRNTDTHKPYDRPEDTWLVQETKRNTNAQKWNALV